MNVTGVQIIYRKEHQSRNGTWYAYTTSVSHKDANGNWDKDYYEVVFVKDAKGCDIPDKTKIDIKRGFLSCRSYTDAGGEKKIVSQVIVQNFDFVEESTADDVPAEPAGYMAMTDEDIPF